MRSTIGAVALLAGLLAPGPAAADGLARFEREIRPTIPAELALTYARATALGPSGFALDGVRASISGGKPGDPPVPVAIRRLAVEDLDFDNLSSEEGPRFLKLRVDGLAFPDMPRDDLRRYGIHDGTADLTLDYRLDPARRVFSLNRLEITLAGLARVELSLVLDGVAGKATTDPAKALDEVSLRTATLTFEDASLLARLIPVIAADDGKTAETYVAEGLAVLGALAQGQGPRTLAVLDALASYAADHARPKGPLRLTLAPPAAISGKDMGRFGAVDALVDVFGLGAAYAGTRPGAALAAVPPAASRPPAGVPCTPGRRLFALSEGGWWPATVREATQQTGRCVVRIEGESDDIVVAPERMAQWSIDGPGTAATACRTGDKVLMRSDGAWYPADVKGAAGRGCTVVMEDDDEEHTVELRRLRVLAR